MAIDSHPNQQQQQQQEEDQKQHHHHEGSNKRRKRSSSASSSNRWDKESTRIVIVGAGLAGLAAAIALEQAGFTNIALYERDVSPSSSSASSIRRGYGLTLSYNPKGPLQKLNHILEQVAQRDCPSRAHYVLAPNGTVLGYFGHAFYQKPKSNNNNSNNNKAWGHRQRGNLRIPRHELREILLEQVKSPIVWNKRVMSVQVMQETTNTNNNNKTKSSTTSQQRKLELQFEDGTMIPNVDLLVAADGIRSKIVTSIVPPSLDLHYLGVVLILGIADFCHPLLDERGFYTLDGHHRLFTMPYQGSRLEDENVLPRRVMWQLSFPLDNVDDAQQLTTKGGPEALRDEVLRRCKDWHAPVMDMIRATPLETIWGTALMDRDPRQLHHVVSHSVFASNVVVLGDACHSMSPFKGQGANQALLDGPLLASWLQRANKTAAIQGFWREMVERTALKVEASAQAARYLHSPQVLEEPPHFAGVQRESINQLLAILRDEAIGASKADQLDHEIRKVIEQLQIGIALSDDMDKQERIKLEQHALSLAKAGDTHALRNLSLQHASAIRQAWDMEQRTCLYMASKEGHFPTCRWLLTEVFIPHDDPVDESVRGHIEDALQIATDRGHDKIVELLSLALTVMSKQQQVKTIVAD